jgi:predicted nucleic-acid-binding protein
VIGLDTNVVVRYIVQDDREQARAATTLIETQCTVDDPGFVSTVVLAELVWVLERAYGYARARVADVLAAILTSVEIKAEQPDIAHAALVSYRDGPADFADYLIGRIDAAHGCEATATFDKRSAKSGFHRLIG